MMFFNDKSSTGGPEVANLFKEYFSSVHSDLILNTNSCLNYSKNFIDICNQPLIKFSTIDIFEAIISLDPCPGPDGLPNILRSCVYSLSVPICKIFNRPYLQAFFLLNGKIVMSHLFLSQVIITW